MNENRKRGTSNNKILTAIAIASLFIGSSKIEDFAKNIAEEVHNMINKW